MKKGNNTEWSSTDDLGRNRIQSIIKIASNTAAFPWAGDGGQVHAAFGALEPRIFGYGKQHEIVIALIGDNDGLAARVLAHFSNGAVEFPG